MAEGLKLMFLFRCKEMYVVLHAVIVANNSFNDLLSPESLSAGLLDNMRCGDSEVWSTQHSSPETK